MERRILIALDDSGNAMRAVEFVAGSFTPDTHITLFSVIQDTAAICEMNSPELTAYFLSEKTAFCALEDKKKTLLEAAQEKAKTLLLKTGFKEKNIALKLEIHREGIARGIVREARAGYDLVVMGRRGLSGIKEFFLGSVPHKVLNSVTDVSVLLVN